MIGRSGPLMNTQWLVVQCTDAVHAEVLKHVILSWAEEDTCHRATRGQLPGLEEFVPFAPAPDRDHLGLQLYVKIVAGVRENEGHGNGLVKL